MDESQSSGPGASPAILIEDPRWETALPDLIERLHACAAAALRSPALNDAPVGARPTLVLADDARLAELNQRYRGKAGPTNVLAFAAYDGEVDPADPEPELGDVVLSLDRLAAEAEAGGLALARHCDHLVVHGLLHLLGYDHETDAEAAVMEAREAAVLAELGHPDPYRAAS